MKRWIGFTLTAGVALFLLTAPMRATGEEERGRVHSEGRCSGASHWELTMEPEVGIKFEGGVESGVPDQQWHVVLKYYQHVLLDVIETTEEDGGFEIVKVENNNEGVDVARLRARNLDTGEICVGLLEAEVAGA
jgi:hypothetical protein